MVVVRVDGHSVDGFLVEEVVEGFGGDDVVDNDLLVVASAVDLGLVGVHSEAEDVGAMLGRHGNSRAVVRDGLVKLPQQNSPVISA